MSITYRLAEFPTCTAAERLLGPTPRPTTPSREWHDEPPIAAADHRWRNDLDALQDWLSPPRHQIDILSTIPEHDPDRTWLEQILTCMRALDAQNRRPGLLACDRADEPGAATTVAVALFAKVRDVRPGDRVCGGFTVVRDGDAAPKVLPRIYRPICSNGAVMFSHHGQACTSAGSVADQIFAVLATTHFEQDIRRLRVAAQTPLHDLAAFVGRARLHTPLAELARALQREGDQSAWGLINAATAAAQTARSWPQRLDREQDAERVLAALESDAPRSLVARKRVPVADTVLA